jgi:ubiquinone/menaquinone biosynthesis C-methylase UbiE
MDGDSTYRIAGQEIKSDDVILDLGTKDGSELEDCPGTVIGIDIDDSQYPTDTDTELILGDGRRLPFDPNTFDYVYCSVVLEHVNGSKLLISEAARVLRPNGMAYFGFPNRISLLQPHSEVPRYYSLLPKFIGRQLSKFVLTAEQREYYETSLFPLTPLTARRYLHTHFTNVEYTIRISGEMIIHNHKLQKCFQSLNWLATKPPFKYPYELLWPNAGYRCTF